MRIATCAPTRRHAVERFGHDFREPAFAIVDLPARCSWPPLFALAGGPRWGRGSISTTAGRTARCRGRLDAEAGRHPLRRGQGLRVSQGALRDWAARSGSAGMQAQQKLLIEHFQKLGGQVELQRFRVRHPQDGSWVPMANILVRWNPEIADRILLVRPLRHASLSAARPGQPARHVRRRQRQRQRRGDPDGAGPRHAER